MNKKRKHKTAFEALSKIENSITPNISDRMNDELGNII